MTDEIWKDIEGFPNYQVSNKSRLKNVKTGLILKPCLDTSTGYLMFNLYDSNGKPRHKYLHRLVAEAFIPNPENKRLINHIDGNKANPDISNLEWATDSENMKHAFKHGLCENTRVAAYEQQKILAQKPRTQKQIDTARENIIRTNKRPKTERQLETSRRNINSSLCRMKAVESHYDRHPPIRLVETGEIFRSQRELADLLGISESSICAVLHGRKKNAGGYHFEYVNEQGTKTEKKSFLYPHQEDAIKRMNNGCILNGGVGSGKSRTSLYYYFSKNGGSKENCYIPMKPNPPDLYIITTARKRDTLEWEGELAPFLLSTNPEVNYYSNKVVVDSWNNIHKYVDVKGAQFIFDEQRVVGSGAWVNSFLKICKTNDWILLSATAGDKWEDYIPVFIANGFYKNKTEFKREHLVYSNYTKYPKIERYLNTGRLIRLRNRILVDMPIERHTVPHHEDVYVRYDISTYKDVGRLKRNPFSPGYIPCKHFDEGALQIGRDIDISDVTPIMEGWIYTPKNGDYVKLTHKPIKNASELCYIWRKIVNSDVSRQVALLEIFEKHPKMIVFYNFDYELDILKSMYFGNNVEVAEWNGHKHQPIPNSERWVYLVQYVACEGWNCIRTDTIVFFSQNYSYKVMVQAAGRTDRLNTPYTDLYYYHLKSRSGIDLAISKALKEKKKFNETRWVGDRLEEKTAA